MESVVFKNPDGSIVLVVLNVSGSNQSLKVRWTGQAFTYTVSPTSLTTLTWTGTIGPTSTPNTHADEWSDTNPDPHTNSRSDGDTHTDSAAKHLVSHHLSRE